MASGLADADVGSARDRSDAGDLRDVGPRGGVGADGPRLFTSVLFSGVGWITVPGVLYCLVGGRGGRPREFLRQLVALSCVLFTVVTIVTYGAYDQFRYPLPIAVCGALCGFAAIDDLISAGLRLVARRRPTRRIDPHVWRVASALPLLVMLIRHHEIARAIPSMAGQWAVLLRDGSYRTSRQDAEKIGRLCRSVRPGVIVASADPWTFHAWCGNPTISLPIDLAGHLRLQERFLIEARVGYAVGDPKADANLWLATSPYVRPVGRLDDQVVFEVNDLAPRHIAWRQPPPLMCAGAGVECRRAVNR